jgi:hypothetical protein
LVDAFEGMESLFCWSGTVDIPDHNITPRIYFNAAKDQAGQATPATPASYASIPLADDSVTTLWNACKPSSHGVGSKKVYDETYRFARELGAGEFALSAGIGKAIWGVGGVESVLGQMVGYAVRVELYKV